MQCLQALAALLSSQGGEIVLDLFLCPLLPALCMQVEGEQYHPVV